MVNIWEDPKTKYLYTYEAAVIALIGYEGLSHFTTGLRDGMWANAHMYYGLGLDAELAAVKFVVEVVEKYHMRLLKPITKEREPCLI